VLQRFAQVTARILEFQPESEQGLGADECVPSGKWCESTAFRHSAGGHSCARTSKRAGGVKPRIALDQCWVRSVTGSAYHFA
jgi:hypothetical protein